MKYAYFVVGFVLTLVFGFLNSQSVLAYTAISTNISADTIWQTGEVYVVEGNIEVDPGVSLTIQPGVVVKFKEWASLTANGELIVNGTSTDRVYFTSFNDDSVGGDTNGDGPSIGYAGYWNQLRFNSGSSSDVDYATIRFGGRDFEISSNVYINGGTLTLSNSVIALSSNYGIHMADGSVVIENNLIENNIVGIYTHHYGSLALNNNSFVNNSDVAGQFQYSLNTISTFGNTSSGIGKNGFYVYGDMLVNSTWTDEVPYIVDPFIVSSGKTLTINPGAIIKFMEFSKVSVDGTLNANGTVNLPIYFTSLKDDSIGGDTNNTGGTPAGNDWEQIRFNSGSAGSINNSIIRYGGDGFDIYSNVYVAGGAVTISNSTIASSGYFGILKSGGSVSITNSVIDDNGGYGVYNYTTSVIDAKNNYWGDPSGPTHPSNPSGVGDYISDYVDFVPFLTSPPSPVSGKEPVIIVPGILGSRLNRVSDGEEVWPKIGLMAIPGPDNYLNDLKMDENGNEIIDINSSEIIESVISLNQYGDLIQKFEDNGYELGQDLFITPYDWRLDIGMSSNELGAVISRALDNSPTGKVNLVAHSMGGLLVKDYLIRNGESVVNKVIFAGTPHLGAPKAFNLLNYGDDFDLKFIGLGLNKNKAKEIGQNMPAVYELLPSREYLIKTGPYVEDDNGSNLNYDETEQLMASGQLLSDHRNKGLLTRADQFHQVSDGWLPQSANVYNILGCREYDTIGYFDFDSKDSVDIDSVNGDGTVPLVSAEHISGQNYFVAYPQTKINHMGLVGDGRMIDIIYDLVISGNAASLPTGISTTDDICRNNAIQIRRLRFSSHSPVNLHVYDGSGHHTGLTPDGNIDLGVPDSNFVQVGDNTFIFVPEGVDYSIKIEAYATGSFDFKVKELINGAVEEEVIYNDISISNPNLKGVFEFTGINNFSLLGIDREGDGSLDAGYLPDGSWVPYKATIQSTLEDLERIYLLGWTNGYIKSSLINLLKASLPTTKTLESKGKKVDGVLGTAFLRQLEVEYNKGSINSMAFNIIKQDVMWLLEN